MSANFRGEEAPSRVASVLTDDHGDWSLDLEPGDWVLEVHAAEFVPLSTSADVGRWRAREEGREQEETEPREELVTVAAGSESTRDLHLRRGARVRARVTDDRGNPLAGVTARFTQQWISVGPWPRAGFFHQGYLPDFLTSDVEGRFAFGGVWPEGSLTVRLSGEGLVTREVSLAVVDEEQVVKLDRAAAITGVVLDTFGKPLPGARFFGLADSVNDSGNLEEIAVAVDELGRLEGRESHLAFMTPRHSWHTPDSQPMGCLPGAAAAPSTETSADGTFRLEGVALGPGLSAQIAVMAPGFEMELLPADPARDIDVELHPEEE